MLTDVPPDVICLGICTSVSWTRKKSLWEHIRLSRCTCPTNQHCSLQNSVNVCWINKWEILGDSVCRKESHWASLLHYSRGNLPLVPWNGTQEDGPWTPHSPPHTQKCQTRVSLLGEQTTTKAETIVDNFLIAEESIPKIYLIFISPPGLKSHQVCLYHVTFFWEDMNKFLFNPDRKLMTDGQSDFPEVWLT